MGNFETRNDEEQDLPLVKLESWVKIFWDKDKPIDRDFLAKVKEWLWEEIVKYIDSKVEKGERPTIVMVHSFSTNSILLENLYELIWEYCDVISIDLPWYLKDLPALENPTIQNYADYLQAKLEELNIQWPFWISWISFWATIVNTCRKLPKNCAGIIDLEPYTGKESLKMNAEKKKTSERLAKAVIWWGENLSQLVYKIIWRSYIKKWIVKIAGESLAGITLDNIDPRTFFLVWKQLLDISYQDLVFNNSYYHILVRNPNDSTLDVKIVDEVHKKMLKNLTIIDTEVDHYPKWLSKEYFQKHMVDDGTLLRALQVMWTQEAIQARENLKKTIGN